MKLAGTFAAAKAERRAALVTYLMGGDPNLEASLEAAVSCVEAGSDIVELGFPYSDPTADGPTIQRAAERSLAAGTTLPRVLELASAFKRRCEVPLVLMGYVNPVLAFGPDAFFARCAAAGVEAVILPDVPLEEGQQLAAQAQSHGVALVYMLAPTSTPQRIDAVLAASTTFTYFVSRMGVTGEGAAAPEISSGLRQVRAQSRVPVVVGFGVSTPQHAATLVPYADGVVVGSALVSRHAAGEDLRPFVVQLRSALKGP